MRVAYDTNYLYMAKGGVARYTGALLEGLKGLIDAPEILEMAWPVENFGYRQPGRALRTFYREFIWSKVEARRLLARERPDVYHTPYLLTVPVPPRVRRVVTLHDLSYFDCPHTYRPWACYSQRARFQRYKDADHVVSVSRFSADRAMSLLGIPAERITVTPLASGLGKEGEEQKPEMELPSEFFLCVGSLEPRKNLALLARTYELAAREGMNLPPLILSGPVIAGVSDEFSVPLNWIWSGRLDDAEIRYLYRRALGFVFPTKYEGFGLPVLEAMGLGCPVICSPHSSLIEVAGEAALLAEQMPDSFLEAMRTLMTNEMRRSELIAAGLERERLFSWDRCAEATCEAYRLALKR